MGHLRKKCATRIICARMRIAGFVPIPPIRLPMCRQINGRCRATTLRQPLVQFGSPRVLVSRVAPRAEKRKTPYATRMAPRGPDRGRRVGAPRRAVRSIDDSLCTQIALHTSYPPASRGRERNFTIPFLRVRGRTRVQSRDQPANPQLAYPHASRGREWNLQFLILRVRGRTRVRYSACGDARGYVVSRPSAAGTGRQLQRRSLDHSRSHSFVGAQGGGKSAQDCFLMSFSFSSSMPSPGFVGTLMNPPL